jgi:hypothetical protein
MSNQRLIRVGKQVDRGVDLNLLDTLRDRWCLGPLQELLGLGAVFVENPILSLSVAASIRHAFGVAVEITGSKIVLVLIQVHLGAVAVGIIEVRRDEEVEVYLC